MLSSPLSRGLLLLSFLLCVLPFARADEEVLKGHARWEKEISAFEEKDRANPPEKGAIVFVGSSSIKKWVTLEKDFPQHRVLNRGFGGSLLDDSVYFADRVVIPYAPRFIVVYAGSNDINAGQTPEQVFATFQAFVEKVRASLPETPIAFISIAGNPKRWAQVEKVKAANALIEAYAKKAPHLQFIDVFPKMLGPDGLPFPDIFVADQLHMNAKGYALWTKIIAPILPPPDKRE